MKTAEKMFTRAEVSHLVGISERMLRYYESKSVDLLHPQEAPYGHAGVRYSKSEYLKAVSIGNYLELGFSLRQIKQMFKLNTKEDLMVAFDDQIERLNNELDRINLKKMQLMNAKLLNKFSEYLINKDLVYCEDIIREKFGAGRALSTLQKLNSLTDETDESLIEPVFRIIFESEELTEEEFISAMNNACLFMKKIFGINDKRFMRQQIKVMLMAYYDTVYEVDPDDEDTKEQLKNLMNIIDVYFNEYYREDDMQ